ncbi:putative signal peptide protein [Puccinia sorghi]|uniref:Putative signal peptide protein n=1 Tax=Puccinia sorghi TaxID=27349 RepID=A0A0L6VI80_9BASI|nr:putative signal peptide protein [Puccinia sorghi]
MGRIILLRLDMASFIISLILATVNHHILVECPLQQLLKNRLFFLCVCRHIKGMQQHHCKELNILWFPHITGGCNIDFINEAISWEEMVNLSPKDQENIQFSAKQTLDGALVSFHPCIQIWTWWPSVVHADTHYCIYRLHATNIYSWSKKEELKNIYVMAVDSEANHIPNNSSTNKIPYLYSCFWHSSIWSFLQKGHVGLSPGGQCIPYLFFVKLLESYRCSESKNITFPLQLFRSYGLSVCIKFNINLCNWLPIPHIFGLHFTEKINSLLLETEPGQLKKKTRIREKQHNRRKKRRKKEEDIQRGEQKEEIEEDTEQRQDEVNKTGSGKRKRGEESFLWSFLTKWMRNHGKCPEEQSGSDERSERAEQMDREEGRPLFIDKEANTSCGSEIFEIRFK